ncbi:hypothetical protein HPB51_007721 [Rhipicephalus microplus]|uniref:N-acetyltransferase domain-containing protein n=1 Tax=Rhipicephalus microplus TaxID=6941 RepID=A0A9J6DTX6_RHIMP|nr:hypothetical protein HPB51_007721 [Rhipicephalus microplus]
MGYGLRALELLTEYYLGHIPSLEEKPDTDLDSVPLAEEDNGEGAECLEPRKALPPLLLKLSEKRAEQLDYLGVSYGLTADLLNGHSVNYDRTDAICNGEVRIDTGLPDSAGYVDSGCVLADADVINANEVHTPARRP